MATKITATVERNDNHFYAITSDDVIAGCHFGGYGYSVDEAKEDFLEGIRESLAMAREMGKDVTVEADEIKVEYRYDIPSLFNYFSWLNASAVAKKAGINQSKMRAYKSGVATASEKTVGKLMAAVKAMGAELCAVSL